MRQAVERDRRQDSGAEGADLVTLALRNASDPNPVPASGERQSFAARFEPNAIALRSFRRMEKLMAEVRRFSLWGHGLGGVSQSWTAGSRSQSALETPTVIPQLLWLAGLLGFVAIGMLLLIHALILGWQGHLNRMAKAISTRSAEEEVEEEIRDLVERQEGEAS